MGIKWLPSNRNKYRNQWTFYICTPQVHNPFYLQQGRLDRRGLYDQIIYTYIHQSFSNVLLTFPICYPFNYFPNNFLIFFVAPFILIINLWNHNKASKQWTSFIKRKKKKHTIIKFKGCSLEKSPILATIYMSIKVGVTMPFSEPNTIFPVPYCGCSYI